MSRRILGIGRGGFVDEEGGEGIGGGAHGADDDYFVTDLYFR